MSYGVAGAGRGYTPALFSLAKQLRIASRTEGKIRQLSGHVPAGEVVLALRQLQRTPAHLAAATPKRGSPPPQRSFLQ